MLCVFVLSVTVTNVVAPTQQLTAQTSLMETTFGQDSTRVKPGNTNRRGRLSTIDLLIEVACFVKKVNNIFNIKRS